ncbi:MAG TPA: peptidylprolyl isomerase [Allosphingosinicella sp.]|nr:peptidylprolyl isomerase [Allosphingosinicella sp.]
MAGSFLAAAGIAQTAGAPAGLNIPSNPQFLGGDPTVRKATAIVNGHVITESDVDHRVALIVLASEGNIPAEEMPRLREQILRNLVDETLQIQAAEAKEIKIEQRNIDRVFEQTAKRFNRTPKDFAQYLKSVGSSERSLKRQIHSELAWNRLQQRQIEPYVQISEEEVKGILERLNASKGEQKYRIGEIFMSATPETAPQVQANLTRIAQQVSQGASFAAYARQFSEASTAAVGGDLGWVSANQLPDTLAEAARVLPVGRVSTPVAVPGGYSLLLVQETRKELMPDPKDSVLSLKQVSITFPKGTTQAQATPLVQQLVRTTQTMGGCGGAEAAAAKIGADVVSNDQIKAGDLPPALQEVLLSAGIGQATAPFGSVDDKVSVLVLCGRDDPQQVEGPSFDQVYAQLTEQRVNMRARRLLRDLRRDAVVDYR